MCLEVGNVSVNNAAHFSSPAHTIKINACDFSYTSFVLTFSVFQENTFNFLFGYRKMVKSQLC